MERYVGTISRGIRCPIIKQGDDLKEIVVDSILKACEKENITLNDKDVVALTESIVARAQGNYCTIDNIKDDIKRKYPDGEIALIFPITSRNRFSILLKGIAMGAKKLYLMLSYPSDEVGNAFFKPELLYEKDINPYKDVLTLDQFRETFGSTIHEFTGVDYIEYYQEIINEAGCECEILFGNNALSILDYCKDVLCCDIHTRNINKQMLKKHGGRIVLGLDDILNESIDGSGYNEDYGLLGSNKASETSVKLFPRDSQSLVEDIQKSFLEKTGKKIEVMIYGDGAFKDPQGKIWELADPVVSPFYTEGLKGQPNEVKIKYLADNEYKDLKGEELQKAIKESIQNKKADLTGNMLSEGTTPRKLTDLIGSLCDLTSGSGDKGTPIILIQGYFDNYSND